MKRIKEWFTANRSLAIALGMTLLFMVVAGWQILAKEQYSLALIPLGLALLWMLLQRFDTMLLCMALFTPFSINLDVTHDFDVLYRAAMDGDEAARREFFYVINPIQTHPYDFGRASSFGGMTKPSSSARSGSRPCHGQDRRSCHGCRRAARSWASASTTSMRWPS